MDVNSIYFKRENWLFVILGLFLITLPISCGLNSVTVIVIGAFFFIDSKKNIYVKLNSLKKNKLFLLFTLFFLVQLIGLFYTEDIKRGTKLIQNFLPFLVLPLTLLGESLDKKKCAKLLYANAIYMFFLLVVLLITQFVTNNNIIKFEQQLFVNIDISVFYFSAFIYLNIMILLFHLRYHKFKNILNVIIIVFFFYFLILLSARISLIITVFSVIIFFIRYIKFKKNDALKKVFFTFSFLFLFSFVAYQIPQIKKKIDIASRTFDYDFEAILTKNQISLTRNSLEYRVIINYCSLLVFENNLLGVGSGDNRLEMQKQYKKINFRAGVLEGFNCHNQYFEEATKTGVLGVISFILLLGFTFYFSLKEKRLLFYVIIYVSLVCLTESYFYRHHGIMFGAFFMSLFYNIESLKHTKKNKDTFLN